MTIANIWSAFPAYTIWMNVRAWAERPECDCFCHSDRYDGPAGLAGAIIALLSDDAHVRLAQDEFVMQEAIAGAYGVEQRWWPDYIVQQFALARTKTDVVTTTRGPYLSARDARYSARPWQRAAHLVPDGHVQLLCAGVDYIFAHQDQLRLAASAASRPLPGGRSRVTLPALDEMTPIERVPPLTVLGLLNHWWGASRGDWPGAYRNLPEDVDPEGARGLGKGEWPRLLLDRELPKPSSDGAVESPGLHDSQLNFPPDSLELECDWWDALAGW